MYKYRSCERGIDKNREQGFNLYFQGANKQFALKNNEKNLIQKRSSSRKYKKLKKAPLFQDQLLNQKKSYSIHNKNKWIKNNFDLSKKFIRDDFKLKSSNHELKTPKKIKKLIPLFQNIQKDILVNQNSENEYKMLIKQTANFKNNSSFLNKFRNLIKDYQINQLNKKQKQNSSNTNFNCEDKSIQKTIKNSPQKLKKEESIQTFQSSFDSIDSFKDLNQIQDVQKLLIIKYTRKKDIDIQKKDLLLFDNKFQKIDIQKIILDKNDLFLEIYIELFDINSVCLLVVKDFIQIDQIDSFEQVKFDQNYNFISYVKETINQNEVENFIVQKGKTFFENEKCNKDINNTVKKKQYKNYDIIDQNIPLLQKKEEILDQSIQIQKNRAKKFVTIYNEITQNSIDKTPCSIEDSQLSIIKKIEEHNQNNLAQNKNKKLNLLRIKKKLQQNQQEFDPKSLKNLFTQKKNQKKYRIRNNLQSQKFIRTKNQQIMQYSQHQKIKTLGINQNLIQINYNAENIYRPMQLIFCINNIVFSKYIAPRQRYCYNFERKILRLEK